MIDFKINYSNIDLEKNKREIISQKKLFDGIIDTINNQKSLNILNNDSDLFEIKKTANLFSEKYKNIVVLGTGGSNLGARSLINAKNIGLQDNIFFFDNIDPIFFQNSINNFDIENTGFLVVSKSGHTPETLSQVSSILEIFYSKKMNNKINENFIFITEKKESPLYKIGKDIECLILEHNKEIGGRYSIFSNVALLPASIAGLDIDLIRKGAKVFLNKIINNSSNYEIFLGAKIIADLYLKHSININVLMTYSDSLYFFGKWYLQLIAESTGKDQKGLTPIHSIGTTDQHSQLQLFLDGPKNKFFSIITTNHSKIGFTMNEKILSKNNSKFLAGKTMGDLMEAEQKATLTSLIDAGLPVRNIICKNFSENTMGQLSFYFIIETIAICHIIGVDPFTQPAVEKGKILTKKYLNLDN